MSNRKVPAKFPLLVLRGTVLAELHVAEDVKATLGK